MPDGISGYLDALDDETPPREVVILDHEHDALPFDRIQSADLRRIAQYWHDLPRSEGAKLPDWAVFEPFDLHDVVGKLCVLRVQDLAEDEHGIEFTLYGAKATATIGDGTPMSMQRLRVDPLRRLNYEDIRQRATRSIENKAPQYSRKTLSWDNRPNLTYETLMLPFAPDPRGWRVLQPVSLL